MCVKNIKRVSRGDVVECIQKYNNSMLMQIFNNSSTIAKNFCMKVEIS